MEEPFEESDDDNASEEGCIMESLFTCEKYILRSWTFPYVKTSTSESSEGVHLEQVLLCSNQSSTDHDLTGQIVWPAATMLCYFIARHHDSVFKDATVIELGAGAGLAGFYCSHFAKHVIITDGNDVVMRLLRKNLQSQEVNKGSCSVKRLLWGKKEYIQESLVDEECTPNIIIGADVILWPTYTKTFLITLKYLLLMSKDISEAVAYISYIARAHTTTSLLYSTAESLGLQISEIEVNSFLPTPVPSNLLTLEKKLLVIKVKDPTTSSRNWIDDEDTDGRSAPC